MADMILLAGAVLFALTFLVGAVVGYVMADR